MPIYRLIIKDEPNTPASIVLSSKVTVTKPRATFVNGTATQLNNLVKSNPNIAVKPYTDPLPTKDLYGNTIAVINI